MNAQFNSVLMILYIVREFVFLINPLYVPKYIINYIQKTNNILHKQFWIRQTKPENKNNKLKFNLKILKKIGKKKLKYFIYSQTKNWNPQTHRWPDFVESHNFIQKRPL